MNDKYVHEVTVPFSSCDSEQNMTIPAIAELFMNTAILHAEEMGIGIDYMMQKNQFFFIVKTKVHIIRRPKMLEKITITTWPVKPEKVRALRDYVITSEDGETIVTGKMLWAIMDLETREIKKTEDVYPDYLEFNIPEVHPEPFAMINKDFSDAELLGEYTIRSVDIDMAGHFNNIVYIDSLMGCYSNEELIKHSFTDLEINYVSQAYEGETLKYLSRKIDDYYEICAMGESGKPAALIKLY